MKKKVVLWLVLNTLSHWLLAFGFWQVKLEISASASSATKVRN
ncbi:MAG: hypothetical protein ACOXZ9_05100 [Bacteroidales bacterium]